MSDENNEKERQLQKLQNEKETLKSETRKKKNRLDNLNSSAENFNSIFCFKHSNWAKRKGSVLDAIFE